ncbi:twin-arginine translocase TatA/TatE family subunit [Microlunatus elymi]|uniref:Sec-independent protein translocase protein TatA n=2 Tax=Microlunatus elymi TaxID=2596828 RepID=A0A516Q656_9ACTN|nr:twin-arginine translocase TatA/TatE family subunit [Microlunatus elymi]
MAFNLGPTELIIILVIVLVLFGGARLAGLGKSTGRAIKEFKEETKGLGGDDKKDDVVDAEVVDRPAKPVQQTPPAVEAPQQQAPAAQQPQPQSTPAQPAAPQYPTGSSTQPYDSRRDA